MKFSNGNKLTKDKIEAFIANPVTKHETVKMHFGYVRYGILGTVQTS